MMKISKKLMEGIKKKIALVSLAALILNTAMIGVFAPLGNVLRAEDNLCPVDVDVILVMDRSGSMDAGTCVTTYGTINNVTEIWCDSYGGSFDPNDDPSRLLQAKNAAELFLDKLGTDDHSALVSYANTATLDKGLSNIHLDSDGPSSTQSAVDALIAEGGTNIGEAIVEGTAELSASGRVGATKAMILLTDGRPTCPHINSAHSECGYVEDPEDIAYAESKADLAAGLEYKVYTIGLGNNVNTDLLTYIADVTGAQYYPASNGDALEGIYNQISQELCHGSISGCKYEADIDGNINTEEKLSGWVIELNNGNINETQSTVDGCYSFTNLPAGNYTVSEGENADKQPYLQTWPLGLIYDNVSLNGQSLNGFDFGNYFPVCGNSIIDTGYLEYTDETCDDGNTDIGDGCSSTCQIESPINPGDIIINELMWMGSAGDIYDEWIELKNTTQLPIEDLNGCKLYKKGGGEIADLSVYTIDADGYLVVSRKTQEDSNIDTATQNILSNLVLSNDYLEITLYCGETLIDIAGDGYAPLAGYNGSSVIPKKSMSRKAIVADGTSADSWCTAVTQENWDVEAEELGTPGAPNVCNLISGYKFNDESNDSVWDEGEPGISGWTIELYDSIDGLINSLIDTATTIVEDLGYYKFTNLDEGTYFVQEESQSGWQQTTPLDPSYYEITVSEENPVFEDKNFGNYEELEATALVSGCKYNDTNNNGEIDQGEEKLSGWEIQLIGCPYPLDGSLLPKSNINEDPQEGETGYCSVMRSTTTGEDGCYSFESLLAGDYGVNEIDQENWTQTLPTSGMFYSFSLADGEAKTGVDFLNYYESGPFCGDGVCDNNETCSTCPQDCGSCGGGGGGGVIVKPTIIITNEKVVYLGGGEALVTWTTNIETTRQVAYGDDSVTVLGAVPEYGYDSVNGESLDMTKEHSVTIGGLTDGVIYYFRPVADRSGSTGEKVGEEVTYVFEEDEGDVKGIESPPEQPVECNYLLEYIKLGADNNPVEVEKLELFLNEFEGENLAVNGIYEQVDFDAVSRFQEKYNENVLVPWSHEGSTGYVYITTKKMINELYCQREFPLTPEQESEVSAFSARFLSAPIESGEAFDGDEAADFEVPTAEDIEEGRVGGAETEEGEEFTEMEGEESEIEGEESERSQKIEIGLEDEDEDLAAPSSNYYRYILIVLALIIIVLAYRFYNSRKKQKEDIQ